MRKADIQILRDIQKNAEMAMKAIQTVNEKVYDDDFAMQLSRQALGYSGIRNRAVDKMLEGHGELHRQNAVKNLLFVGEIQRDTLLDTSTSHIAELLIRESNKEMTQMYKTLNHCENADRFSVEMAREFMEMERMHIEKLRKFL